MKDETRKYEVKVLTKKGSCDTTLFEKMAKKGDLTSTKLSEVIGAEVTINGYATCEITTDEKTFVISYFDTEEYGLISSGSEIFKESVEDYYGEVERVKLVEVKTKKGKTYKAVPVLATNKKVEERNEQIAADDLPF